LYTVQRAVAGGGILARYRHAFERQHSWPDLPYGFDVWHGEKVLRILWSDQGRFDVATFVRGPGRRKL
jgi:hypothetical protein